MQILRNILAFVMDVLETVTFVGSIFIVVYLFILQPNQVKGASMEPTFDSGDYIFTSKITYKFRPLERGDVVVFRSPRNPDIEFIKRIIGLPGDRIRISDSNIYVNGNLVQESYISSKTELWDGGFVKNNEEVVVRNNEVFVMGDNRPRSSDSREFGPVSIDNIIGNVFFRYYPPQKIGDVDNPIPRNNRSFIFEYLHT